MADYKLAWNAATYVATVQIPAKALPAGSVDAGTFKHEWEANKADPLGSGDSHVFYNHVRDLLYLKGVQDMARVRIVMDVAAKPITAISSTPATKTLPRQGTQLIATSFTPDDASDMRLEYTTSDYNIATVSQRGLITAHAPGVATITVTSIDQGKTDTVVVTVTG